MSSVVEIEQAIAQLSPAQFGELKLWFQAEIDRQWDRQIETDSASGALDFLLGEVEEDIAHGRMLPADEFFHKSKI